MEDGSGHCFSVISEDVVERGVREGLDAGPVAVSEGHCVGVGLVLQVLTDGGEVDADSDVVFLKNTAGVRLAKSPWGRTYSLFPTPESSNRVGVLIDPVERITSFLAFTTPVILPDWISTPDAETPPVALSSLQRILFARVFVITIRLGLLRYGQ